MVPQIKISDYNFLSLSSGYYPSVILDHLPVYEMNLPFLLPPFTMSQQHHISARGIAKKKMVALKREERKKREKVR
jgi:hypothetical protein